MMQLGEGGSGDLRLLKEVQKRTNYASNHRGKK